MKYLKFFFILILISCQKENDNNSGIRYDLYKEIIKYQKENPIDKETEDFLGKKHFIYQVAILPPHFENPEDKKTSIYITLSVFGVGNNLKKNCFGIYENETLQRTIIYDEANLIDKFVKEKKKKNLENYIVKNTPIIDIIYPVKIYNFENGKLKFISKLPGNNNKK